MGGKGGSSKGGGGNMRGRAYGMMLLLTVGAAVFGVMVIHKLRERRIFNLLIQDKDSHLMSLHLLLQKERDYTKEVKRKLEELKAKTYSLRTQKMELHNKLMELQSVTASLKEEQRALESALEDKQNEIKILKEREMDSVTENSQVIALTELLKQKEADIEVMRSHIEKLTNIMSVSMVDPLTPPANTTRAQVSLGSKDKQSEGSVNANDAEASRTGDSGSGKATEGTEQKEIPGEGQLQKVENNQDGEAGEKNAKEGQVRGEISGDTSETTEDHQDDEGFGVKGEKGERNITEGVERSKKYEVIKNKDGSGDEKTMADEEHGNSRNGQPGNLMNTQEGEGQSFRMISNDGIQLERLDRSRVRSDYGSLEKKNRWKVISRDRELMKTVNSEGVGVSMGHRRWRTNEGGDKNAATSDKKGEGSRDGKLKMFENSDNDEGLRTRTYSGDQVDLKDEGVVANEGRLEMTENSGFRVKGDRDVEKTLEGRNQEEISRESPYHKYAEDLRMKALRTHSNDHARKEDETVSKHRQLEKLQHSQYGGGLEVGGINEKSGLVIDAIEQKPDEEIRQLGQEVGVAFNIKHNGSERTKDTNGKEEPEKLEVSQGKTEADYAVSNEANSKLTEDEEDHKENAGVAEY